MLKHRVNLAKLISIRAAALQAGPRIGIVSALNTVAEQTRTLVKSFGVGQIAQAGDKIILIGQQPRELTDDGGSLRHFVTGTGDHCSCASVFVRKIALSGLQSVVDRDRCMRG